MINESNRLVRVLKHIKRKKADGSSASHHQAFYVKKASPGDRYAQVKDSSPKPQKITPQAQMPAEDQELPIDDTQDDAGFDFRLELPVLQMPWMLEYDEGGEDPDPIPDEVRRRFDPDQRQNRVRSPVGSNVPVFSIKPGEDLLWGSTEAELLNRLRTGVVTGVRSVGSLSKPILAKIESIEGIVERVYITFDATSNDQLFDLFGDMYGIDKDDVKWSHRRAASYELAKAVGMDDLVPPCIYRYDEHDGLEPILSTAALDSLSISVGVSPVGIKESIGRSASVELWVDDTSGIWEQPWFAQFVDIDSDAPNVFYSMVPIEIKVGLLRAAVFDFLTWNGLRTWQDVLFCSSERHPVHLINNAVTFPDPRAMAAAVAEYAGAYYDGCPDNIQYMPMLWNDIVSMATLRAFDGSTRIFESAALEAARRMRGERAVDMVRALADHGISLLAIAGVLVRAAFLRFGATTVIRDPLVVARYFLSVVTDAPFDPGFDIDLENMVSSIDETINAAIHAEFSFIDAMKDGE